MQVTNKAFKAYDVRGVYPTEVNEEMAYRMGRIFSAMFAAETVVVGHDIRLSGRALVDALTEGLRHGGTKVIDIGQCGTEMIYFATAHLKADGGIMVTASHNPKEYNGMKLVLTAPVSEIYSEAYGLAKMIILAMIVAFILSAVIGIVMGTGLTKPIRQLTSVIEQTAALDFRPTEAGAKLRKQKDEIGDMATKIHDMRKKLRAMMENLQQTQQVLETNTGNLNQLMKQNSAYAEDNSAATQELAAGMEETSANAAHIVENVGIMRESSDNIQRLAEDGEKNSGQIQERAGEMERISTESRHKTDQMYAVMKQKTDAAVEQAKSVQKINALTDNIKQISSQTNLLALNANIEAARAGEAGRGFAVVASEIGDLATQTLDTVSTIDEIVGEVNSSVSNMTECLTTIMEFLEQTVLGDYEHFAQVGEQYHADADTFQQIMQQTKEAVDALEQHIGEISSTVSEINSMVEQSTDGISGIAEKSGSTQNLVTEGYDKLQECTQSVNVIRDFVAQFHLD